MSWKPQTSHGLRGTVFVIMFWFFALPFILTWLTGCTTQTDWAGIAKTVGQTKP